MSNGDERIKELIEISVKLIKEGKKIAEQHRELVQEIKRTLSVVA
jgi:hypothetical protein